VNYLSEINAFGNWVEVNPLPPTAELFWYKLMWLNNRAGWQRGFLLPIHI
jgi:hypothetical protein